MKKRILFLPLFAIILSTGFVNAQGNKNKLSANVTRTSVVKLGADEVFDYSENCIDLGSSLDHISFIVTKRAGNSTQCYTYKNGSRTPVACPNTNGNSGCHASLQCSYSPLREVDINSDEFKKYVTNETEAHAIQQPAITDEQLKMMATYMTPAQIAEVKKQLAEAQKQTANQSYSTIKSSSISFNGKKYGPYKMVQKLYLTQDGKNFFSIVTEEKPGNSTEGQNKMITSASAKTLLLGDFDSPTSCIASANNSDFGFVALSMTSQKYVIKVASGKTYEVPMTEGFSGAWFSNPGNHIIYLSQTKIYRDGQLVKTFNYGEYSNACDLFVGANGSSVTQIKDNKISFADGDHFEYPLKVSIIDSGGKPYYKWLAYENNEVVVYQKPY